MTKPSRAARIQDLVQAALSPTTLRVTDDSARHAGHAGARPEGETHYTVLVVSGRFAGLSRVARHRLVTDALATEFTDGLHALSLTLRTPEEQASYGPV